MVSPFETVKKAREKVSFNIIKFGVLAVSFGALDYVNDIPGTRDNLPEPFDIIDHAGNMNWSIEAGYIAGLLYAAYVARKNERGTPPPDRATLKTRMALGGLAAGLVVNSLVETKFGIGILNWDNGPDPIDLVYGVAVATGAALLPGVRQRPAEVTTTEPVDESEELIATSRIQLPVSHG